MAQSMATFQDSWTTDQQQPAHAPAQYPMSPVTACAWAVRMSSMPNEVQGHFYNIQSGKALALVNRQYADSKRFDHAQSPGLSLRDNWDILEVSANSLRLQSLAQPFSGMPWLIIEPEGVRLANSVEDSVLPGGQSSFNRPLPQASPDIGSRRFSSTPTGYQSGNNSMLGQARSVSLSSAGGPYSPHATAGVTSNPTIAQNVSPPPRSIARRPVGSTSARKPSASAQSLPTVPQAQSTSPVGSSTATDTHVAATPQISMYETGKGNVLQPLQSPPSSQLTTSQPRSQQQSPPLGQPVPVQRPVQQALAQPAGPRRPVPQHTHSMPTQQSRPPPQGMVASQARQQHSTTTSNVNQTAAPNFGAPLRAVQSTPSGSANVQQHLVSPNKTQSPAVQAQSGSPAWEAPPQQVTKKDNRMKRMMNHPGGKIAVRLAAGFLVGGSLGSQIGKISDQWSGGDQYMRNQNAAAGGKKMAIAAGVGALAGALICEEAGGDVGDIIGSSDDVGDSAQQEDYTSETYTSVDYGSLIDGQSTTEAVSIDDTTQTNTVDVDYGALIDGQSAVETIAVADDTTTTTTTVTSQDDFAYQTNTSIQSDYVYQTDTIGQTDYVYQTDAIGQTDYVYQTDTTTSTVFVDESVQLVPINPNPNVVYITPQAPVYTFQPDNTTMTGSPPPNSNYSTSNVHDPNNPSTPNQPQIHTQPNLIPQHPPPPSHNQTSFQLQPGSNPSVPPPHSNPPHTAPTVVHHHHARDPTHTRVKDGMAYVTTQPLESGGFDAVH